MGRILTTRFCCLDSATIGHLAHGYWSGDSVLRNRISTQIESLLHNGWVLGVSGDHILELIAHDDESRCEDRLRFIKSIPHIGWIRPFDARCPIPGGIVDIQTCEIQQILKNPDSTFRDVACKTRACLWQSGSGEELIGDVDEFWATMRALNLSINKRSKHIVSINRTDPAGVMSTKLSVLKDEPTRKKSEVPAFLKWFAKTMTEQLKQHGDPRIQNPAATAASFSETLVPQLRRIFEDDGPPVLAVMKEFGLSQEDFTENMTVGDVCELAVYVRQLEVFERRLPELRGRNHRDVPPTKCPSWLLRSALGRRQSQEHRVRGSNLADGYLATLSLYSESVQVDKRTRHHLSDVQRVDPIGPLINHYFSGGTLDSLLHTLPA